MLRRGYIKGFQRNLVSRAANLQAQTRNASTDVDVAIVGGGPAGLSLAASLKHHPATAGLSVVVIDGQPLSKLREWAPKGLENRVSSLTPSSVRHLKDIGAWRFIRTDRVCAYDEMRVWDGVSGAAIDFDSFATGGEVATMCENSNLQQALLQVLDTTDTQILEARPELKRASNGWPTLKAGETTFNARLVVGADGQQSPVRQFAGIQTRGWDYGRNAVVATLELEYDDLRKCAFQRFLVTGPIAVLPLPENFATMVWSTLPSRASWLKALAPEAMAVMINAALRLDQVDIDYVQTHLDPTDSVGIIDELQWRLERLEADPATPLDPDAVPVPVVSVQPGSVAAFPLRMRHVDSYIGDRVALVGDAAHATHPLAGQGLNMGQRDATALTEAIAKAAERGLDIGSPLALEPYPRAVYASNHMTIGAADKLHKLYSTDAWPAVALRTAGLSLLNSSSGIKSLLMQQASK